MAEIYNFKPLMLPKHSRLKKVGDLVCVIYTLALFTLDVKKYYYLFPGEYLTVPLLLDGGEYLGEPPLLLGGEYLGEPPVLAGGE